MLVSSVDVNQICFWGARSLIIALDITHSCSILRIGYYNAVIVDLLLTLYLYIISLISTSITLNIVMLLVITSKNYLECSLWANSSDILILRITIGVCVGTVPSCRNDCVYWMLAGFNRLDIITSSFI